MGLFGVFVVEPAGSEYFDPLGTGPAPQMVSGWQAMIQNGQGPDFREFVLIYHEVGDEAFRPVNKHGDFLPQRDPLTDALSSGCSGIELPERAVRYQQYACSTRIFWIRR